jgi:hypothetical protein
MKIIVNGQEQDVEVLYGASVIFNYENVVKMANANPDSNPTITYKDGEKTGQLVKGGKSITVKIESKPIFNVISTGNA